MIKEGKIGVAEATSIIILMIGTKVVLSSPRVVVEEAGPAAWLLTSISCFTAAMGFYFVLKLLQRFPNRDLPAIYQAVLGKYAGGFLSLVTAALFFFNSSITAREFIETVKVYEYPLTPPSVFLIFIIITAMLIITMGFETVARVNVAFSKPLFLGLILLFALSYVEWDPSNLFPLLGHGPYKLIKTGLERSSAYGEVVALAVIAGSLQGLEHIRKSGFAALFLSVSILGGGFVVYGLVFPYQIGQENTIPLLMMTRIIEFGRFFQRFESLFLLIWSTATVLMVVNNLYIGLSIYCKVFKIDDMRAVLYPSGILLFTVALFPPSLTATFGYIQILRVLGWTVYLAVPFLVLLLAVVLGKKGGAKNV